MFRRVFFPSSGFFFYSIGDCHTRRPVFRIITYLMTPKFVVVWNFPGTTGEDHNGLSDLQFEKLGASEYEAGVLTKD